MSIVRGKTASTRTKNALGREIRLLRVERDLSIRDLAVTSGVSVDTIWSLENGLRSPGPLTLGKVSRGLGVPESHLLDFLI